MSRTLSCFLLFVGILIFSACQETINQGESAKAELEGSEGSVADIIRNPVTADQDADNSKIAQMSFVEEDFQFGEVDAGAVIEHTFQFTNSGSIPLVISDVRSTCGCTVANWPEEPIAPGEQGEIPVRFDTKNKKGNQSKAITITANTYPGKTNLYLKGRIRSN